MKYIATVLILMAFTSCGSNSSDKKEVKIEDVKSQNVEVVKETSPLNVEKDKTPPAIPKI